MFDIPERGFEPQILLPTIWIFMEGEGDEIKSKRASKRDFNKIMLEHTYKPLYDYQDFSPLDNGTDSNRQKYTILQTHWH